MMGSTSKRYPRELRDRAVWPVFESARPVVQVAADLGVGAESLRNWVRQAEADTGGRADRLTSSEREELARPRGEAKELRRANEVLKATSVCFARELDSRRLKCAFIDERRGELGVEPICRALDVSASAQWYRRRMACSLPTGWLVLMPVHATQAGLREDVFQADQGAVEYDC